MQIHWKRCHTYEQARDESGVIYLHEWDDRPFYWGKAHRSFFGGHKRTLAGLTASGRYNAGYRHWIEGCLQHGAKLYIGALDEAALKAVDEVENFLICTYGHVMNMKFRVPRRDLEIAHSGDIPTCIARTTAVS